MKYLKADHYLMNYDNSTKEFIGTFYFTRELALEKNRINTLAWEKGLKVQGRYYTLLENKDSLNFTNHQEGDEKPLAQGRFLNKDYEEALFNAELPDKNLHVEGVVSKIGDAVFVTTKTVFRVGSQQPSALIQEVIQFISKEEFDKALA